ncbi:substrate-binding domain-containing protein [Planotetraspora sp. A-T 1434]|uniref:substrate-binding domain-containing protein n=1 Tax=Planotetraspora sp. A-T 1434 TaxID=2979219 RepID=UPI0021C085C5|nr:substrate-binding domain-containing protein [Planotetraspora sp. A-T 1434]MCT9933722.1 substrate-binding domain-containing protein [Planotetraspora sp. A-T 1434]
MLLDADSGGRIATEHLVAYGHRRIALISDSDPLSSVHARAEGHRTALRAAGVAVDPASRWCATTSGASAARRWNSCSPECGIRRVRGSA